MMRDTSFVKKYLRCPLCGSDGLQFDSELYCGACGRRYPQFDGLIYLCRDEIREFARSRVRLTEHDMPRDGEPDKNTVTLANIDYHNRIAETYEKDMSSRAYLAEGSPAQKRLAEVVDHLCARTGHELWIDVGCGTGNVLRHTRGVFVHSLGLDVAPEMLRIALGRDFDVFVASAYELPFQTLSADVVSAVSLVHHLSDPSPFFSEALRVLKPGGYLYTDWDPNAEAFPYLSAYSRSWLVRKLWPVACRCVAAVKGLHTEQQNQEYQSVARLAEYHRNIKMGLKAEELKASLAGMGFETVDVYFHDNAASLFGPLRLSLLTRAALWTQGQFVLSSPARFAPQFAILAKKKTGRAAP